MKSLGGFLAVIGLFSVVLSFLGRELVILAWIDTWGTTVGWVIRIALIVIGAAIWFLASGGGGEAEGEG